MGGSELPAPSCLRYSAEAAERPWQPLGERAPLRRLVGQVCHPARISSLTTSHLEQPPLPHVVDQGLHLSLDRRHVRPTPGAQHLQHL